MANLMIQGTTSSAGKSFLVAGLCRYYKKKGYRVAPFKSQNMSSGFYRDSEKRILSSSQALQAIAAGLEPSPRFNPILLVPQSDSGSLIIFRGQEKEAMEARDYFSYRKKLRELVLEDYKKLEEDMDLIILEGAGSPAEINLKENDLVNMGLAQMVDAPVFLVADIDRGGVFASLYGTVMLLEEQERARVRGLIINKFRGDIELLKPGIEMFKDYLDIPVIGTLPYMDIDFEGIGFEDEKGLDKALDQLADSLEENLDMAYVDRVLGL